MEKIVRKTLTDQIFDYIQDQIANGNWKRGEKLPSETELAEKLGVSRMSLRAAIQRSNTMGLTETKVGEGTFVKKISMRPFIENLLKSNLLSADNDDINDMRNILQIGSFRLALKLPTLDEDIEVLESFYNDMISAAENNDTEGFHKADTRFHRHLCKSCRNEMMYIIYDAIEYLLEDVTRRNVVRSLEYNGSYENILNYHKGLLDTIKAKDLDGFIKIIDSSEERSHKYSELFKE